MMELQKRKQRIILYLWVIVGTVFVTLFIMPFFSDSIVDTAMWVGLMLPLIFLVLFYHVVRYLIEKSSGLQSKNIGGME